MSSKILQGGNDSFRSQSTETSETSSASKNILQREAIEYDRRQIKRKLAETLKERGIDPETEVADEDWNDEESVYDDTEIFPWKQRDAAVQAAAIGGKTEGRMEGFDSLERALQAHQHKIHYGRGSGFGWSSQQKQSSSALLLKQQKLQSVRQMSEWASFRDLNNVEDGIDKGDNQETKLLANDAQLARRTARQSKLQNTLFLLVAIVVTLGFAYYIEVAKVNTYQSYLPEGYNPKGELIEAMPTAINGSQVPSPNGETGRAP